MCLPLFLVLLRFCSPVASQSYWTVQRDDLSEYLLDRLTANVRSSVECATLSQPQHQALDFSPVDQVCRMYSCRFGSNGCRKCRNAKNVSKPLLMTRRLNEQGHTCWRTFQHRVDGSVDFYRNWTEYLTAFGPGEDANYWMGLEAIYQLTRAGGRRVRWEMSLWNGTMYWWEDASFTVQGADQGYLLSLGEQDIANSNVVHCPLSGGAFMNGQKFSTPERDQDASPSVNCAVQYQGAWWYSSCHCFNPNGRYFTPPTAFNLAGDLWADGLTFENPGTVYPLTHYYSMQTFECMLADWT